MGLFGGSAESVMAKGARQTAKIVGIEVKRPGEDATEPDVLYAVRLGDGRTIGIRQRLDPDDVVRLGMSVEVFVRGDDAVIDAAPHFDQVYTHRWKMLRKPPEDGIDDETLGLTRIQRNHQPATVRITSIDRTATMFGIASKLTCTVAVTMTGDTPYETQLSWGGIPGYASHLLEVGRELPAFVDRKELDKIWIDWPAAATKDPGIGVAPAPLSRHNTDDAHAAVSAALNTAASGLADRLAKAAGGVEPVDASESIDGVTFEQWIAIEAELSKTGLRNKPKQWDSVAVRHGVAPGAYPAVSAKWGRAMITRPDLASRYAEAIR